MTKDAAKPKTSKPKSTPKPEETTSAPAASVQNKKQKTKKDKPTETSTETKETPVSTEPTGEQDENKVTVAPTVSLGELREERNTLMKSIAEKQVLLKKLLQSIDKVEQQTVKSLEKRIPKSKRNKSDGDDKKQTKSGLNNVYNLTPILAKVCDLDVSQSHGRADVMKRVHSYIKTHKLNKSFVNKETGKIDGRIIVCDDNFSELVGELNAERHSQLTYFNLNHYLKRHFLRI